MGRNARRYLLLPTHMQVWRIVRAYMELAERGTPGTRHATLCFLMRLGILRPGRAHRMDDSSLDDAQRAALADMALLGLLYRPPDEPNLYYATALSQHLLSGGARREASASDGFVILETNFRLYAYTDSPLWAQVLSIFTHVEYVLPNLLVGSLTRRSIQKAVDAHVSAAEIQAFLERNAHPRMASHVPVLPETVVNQVMLWAKERGRLQFASARLYEGFDTLVDFEAAEAYARDNGMLLWARKGEDGRRCALAVAAAAHVQMKKFLRSLTAPGES
jgi:transcription initiation factor TFIIH subunit 4